ncbi:MAG: helix-turn-helix domain-containing protein [Thiotrichales bacterium]|nr:helix-turn-helix domain-containing protein [Thiotrichales bacterium]
MKYDKKQIGQRFREARKFLGMSQTALAEKAGMSLPGYQPNERGTSTPSASILYTFSELGINPYWLLTGKGNMEIGEALQRNIRKSLDRSVQNNIETIDCIERYLVEVNYDPEKMNDIKHSLISSDIVNTEHFNHFLNLIAEPFKSFHLLPVINPKDESAFHNFGSDLNLYEFHPVRRNWVAENKLDPKQLKALFPSDDAMAPTINQGEIAIIDGRTSVSGSGLYALSIQDKVLIRRLEHKLSGLNIITDNEHYSNEILSDEDAKKIKVLGRVVRIDSYR